MKEHEIEVQHFEVVDSVEDAKYVPPRLRKLMMVTADNICMITHVDGMFCRCFVRPLHTDGNDLYCDLSQK